MNLKLIRRAPTDVSIPGDLLINGFWECYTLENKDKATVGEGFFESPNGGLNLVGVMTVVVVEETPSDLSHLLLAASRPTVAFDRF